MIMALPLLVAGCGEVVKKVWFGSQGLEVPENFGGEKEPFSCSRARTVAGQQSITRNSAPGESYRVDVAGLKTACEVAGNEVLTQIKIKFRVIAGPGNLSDRTEIRYYVQASDLNGTNSNKKFYTSYFAVPGTGKSYEVVEIIEHLTNSKEKNARLTVGIAPDPRPATPRQAAPQRTVPQGFVTQGTVTTIPPVQSEPLAGQESLIWGQ